MGATRAAGSNARGTRRLSDGSAEARVLAQARVGGPAAAGPKGSAVIQHSPLPGSAGLVQTGGAGRWMRHG